MKPRMIIVYKETFYVKEMYKLVSQVYNTFKKRPDIKRWKHKPDTLRKLARWILDSRKLINSQEKLESLPDVFREKSPLLFPTRQNLLRSELDDQNAVVAEARSVTDVIKHFSDASDVDLDWASEQVGRKYDESLARIYDTEEKIDRYGKEVEKKKEEKLDKRGYLWSRKQLKRARADWELQEGELLELWNDMATLRKERARRKASERRLSSTPMFSSLDSSIATRSATALQSGEDDSSEGSWND
eukprot:scaffold26047_cov162-Cylindrotheca_fusiformis.AAC.2